MNQERQWQKCCLAALLAASLAAPAAAAERTGPAARARAGAEALGLREALESVLAGWVGELARFTAAWQEDGHMIDPNGLQVTNPPTVPSSGVDVSGTAPTDDGHMIDPNG